MSDAALVSSAGVRLGLGISKVQGYISMCNTATSKERIDRNFRALENRGRVKSGGDPPTFV
jgi:hypothetical protein